MKLICTQENLTQALSALDRVVGKQSSLPILSNFLFESENGRLKISATNLEIGIMVFVGAKIEKEGKFAVPARILSQFTPRRSFGVRVDRKPAFTQKREL